MVCRLQTIRSGRIAHIAIDTSRFQVRSRCQHHRLAVIRRAGVRFQSFDLTFFHDQLCHLSLTDRQVIGIFHGTAHLAGVFLLVRLRAERMHRRSLRLVEHLGLYKGFIYIFPISPPSASSSRTKWPFELPPTFGLHGIRAMLSTLTVNTIVSSPSLALASAASQPACPAPTTATS